MLSQGLEAFENNDKGTEPLVIYKRSQAITNTKKKAVRDYYFDPANSKPAYKHVQEEFLQELGYVPSQSTIFELLSTIFAHLDTGISRPSIKKQRHAQ